MMAQGKALWHSHEVCLALELSPEAWAGGEAFGVSIDSRTIREGDIFVALRGGHDFIGEAFKRGAVAAICEKGKGGKGEGVKLEVADSLLALQALARAARNRFEGKVIGITGSVGKTTCKEMVAHILRKHKNCYANKGNLNNHIGLPLALANLPADADFGVFEMGMNHAGEIDFLTSLANPHVVCITNIAPAHLENFKDVQGIADAKAEIFSCRPQPEKALIGEGLQDMQDYLSAIAKQNKIAEIRRFGTEESQDYQYISHKFGYSNGSLRNRVTSIFRGEVFEFDLGAAGEHMALSAVSAYALVDMLELSNESLPASDLLADFTAPTGRGEITRIGENILLIDESYNASPASVSASLQTLAEIAEIMPNKPRKVAILGDMLELGANEVHYHQAIEEQLQTHGIDVFISVGKLMEVITSECQHHHFANVEDLLDKIDSLIVNGDIILLKASHSIGFGKLAHYLKSRH